jgi:hypothetical protein
MEKSNNESMKFHCLQLAATRPDAALGADNIVADAEKFFAFVTGSGDATSLVVPKGSI